MSKETTKSGGARKYGRNKRARNQAISLYTRCISCGYLAEHTMFRATIKYMKEIKQYVITLICPECKSSKCIFCL